MSKDEVQWEKHTVKALSGKIMEHVLLASIPEHVKDKKAISNTQHGLAKGTLCVANLTALCVKMSGIPGAVEAFVTRRR